MNQATSLDIKASFYIPDGVACWLHQRDILVSFHNSIEMIR